MKIAVLWHVAPCSLVDTDRRFRRAYCLHHQGDDPDDGGNKLLCNVGQYLPDYTVSHLQSWNYTRIGLTLTEIKLALLLGLSVNY
jgi:hypothetical protein